MSRFPSNVRFEYLEAHHSNFTRGSWRKDHIVLHWWNDPRTKPQFDGVVSWFRNPTANVSIQYMVEANRITQMIPESAMAWHAGNSHANRHGIGIEVNPRLNAGDYETTAVLVAEIWKRRGRKLPLRRHREVNRTTACPGHMDVARIKRRADQIYSGASTPTPAAPAPATPVKEGIVMSAKDFWNHREHDFVNDKPNSYGFMLARIHQYVNGLRSVASQVWRQQASRDFVNGDDNANSYGFMTSRIHQYGFQTRGEVRELKAMVKALAKAQDEGTGRILEAVENAEREAIKVNAAEVAAELELSVKEDQED